jgi:hypothetical protein
VIEDVSRLLLEARLDEVIAEDKIEVFVSHGQEISNGGLEKLAKDLSQQKKEEEETDEEPPVKFM